MGMLDVKQYGVQTFTSWASWWQILSTLRQMVKEFMFETEGSRNHSHYINVMHTCSAETLWSHFIVERLKLEVAYFLYDYELLKALTNLISHLLLAKVWNPFYFPTENLSNSTKWSYFNSLHLLSIYFYSCWGIMGHAQMTKIWLLLFLTFKEF